MSPLPPLWPPPPPKSRPLFGKSVLIAWTPIFLILFVGFVVWWFALRPMQIHRDWYHKVEHRILKLSVKRPASVSEKDWAKCIHWTWNLHSNYGHSYFRPDAHELFLAEFDHHLAERVDMKTIDWIWDQYLIHAPNSKSYAHYRPTTSEVRAALASEPLEWFTELLRKRDKEAD